MTNSAMPLIAFMVSMLQSVMHLVCATRQHVIECAASPSVGPAVGPAQPAPEWDLQSSWGSGPSRHHHCRQQHK